MYEPAIKQKLRGHYRKTKEGEGHRNANPREIPTRASGNKKRAGQELTNLFPLGTHNP